MKRLIGFLVLASLQACSPPYIYQLNSLEDTNEWYMGRSYSSSCKDSISIRCALSATQRYQCQFYVAITNNRKENVLINPSDFYAFAKLKPDSFDVNSTLYWAIDPEAQIDANKRAIVQEDQQYTLALASRAGEGILNLGIAIASINKKVSDEEYKRREEQQYQREREMANRDALHLSRINDYNNQLNYWSNNVIRKTTLHPGETLESTVSFPLPGEEVYLLFCFKVDSSINTFKYQLIKK